jgi:hypothetical protein
LAEKGKLEKAHLKEVGILICGIQWDSDQQKTNLVVLESYVGPLSGRGSIDRAINTNSKLVRMYKNVSIPVETDFFVINDQKIASLGMDADECQKYINYKTSIIDPITYVLESIYSDVDSLELDVILDSGLTSTAFAAYVAKNDDGETFFENDKVRTKIDSLEQSRVSILTCKVDDVDQIFLLFGRFLYDFSQNSVENSIEAARPGL